jgi:hypothetical protein
VINTSTGLAQLWIFCWVLLLNRTTSLGQIQCCTVHISEFETCTYYPCILPRNSSGLAVFPVCLTCFFAFAHGVTLSQNDNVSFSKPSSERSVGQSMINHGSEITHLLPSRRLQERHQELARGFGHTPGSFQGQTVSIKRYFTNNIHVVCISLTCTTDLTTVRSYIPCQDILGNFPQIPYRDFRSIH